MTGAASEAREATWRAVCASERGSSHAFGTPNQDAVRCDPVSRPGRPTVWVATVADGHGGSRYVRSDVGARAAVDVAMDVVRRALEDSPDADPAAVLHGAAARVVAQWCDAVRDHASTHPYSADEVARTGGRPPDADDLTSYGTTLLMAVVGEHGVAVAQVGDGDALVRSHGFATRPVPGDDRLVAGQTTSLCLATAVEDFRHWSLTSSGEPDLVLLATDGYANSFAQEDWWQDLVGDLASHAEELGFDELQRRLPDWLAESAAVGGDDVSAVLLVREPLAVATRAAAPAGTADLDRPAPLPRTLDLSDGGASPPGPVVTTRPRSRVVAPSIVGCLAVVACVLALFLLMRDETGSPADPPTVPVTSTTPADAPPDDTSEEPGGRRDGLDADRDGVSPEPSKVKRPPKGGSGRGNDGGTGPEEGAAPLQGSGG